MSTRSDRQRAPAAPPRRAIASRKSGFGGTLLGLFIGIALGLGLAAGVAYYITKSGNPYPQASGAREPAREPAKESPRTARADPAAAEKPRFDFYKILPGGEAPKGQPRTADRATADRATAERANTERATAERAPPERAAPPDKAVAKLDDRAATDKQGVKASDRFWLQAGSFSTEADAENLKAKLAFAGLLASVQPATLADKGTRYRVRLGPYDNTEELNRMKAEAGSRGFEVSVIRN